MMLNQTKKIYGILPNDITYAEMSGRYPGVQRKLPVLQRAKDFLCIKVHTAIDTICHGFNPHISLTMRLAQLVEQWARKG